MAGAAANNVPWTGGNPFLQGDANLDGVVDGSDFGSWNAAKFTNNTNWSDGNFNADLVVDGSDFGLWNAHKFTSSVAVLLVNAGNPPTGLGAATSTGAVPKDTWQRIVRNESGPVLADDHAQSPASPALLAGWKARESWWRTRSALRGAGTIGALRMHFSHESQDAVDRILLRWYSE